jgi:3-hydroxyisobutyrate dehydrogenase-like beta-hydroxyacid dehydrogenase
VTKQEAQNMQIGFVGLGKMGGNMRRCSPVSTRVAMATTRRACWQRPATSSAGTP